MDELDKAIVPRREHVGISVADDMTMPGKRDRKPDGRFAVGDLVMNRYKILAELGQGGMGVVYRCLDETAGIEVALKALPPELSHNTIEMEDIKDNFQLVSKLIHQNIAVSKNLERDNSNGNYYLIMECCEGEDLRHWIKRKRKEGDLKLEEILSIVQQVADALDYAHEQKVIHRDIKPGNIMINSSGKIKVLDFGLAAQIHTSMTRVSMAYHGTSGTGPYMAPEQWRGRAQGAASDQYALAVMTYEMLAGHLPFESADPAVLQQAVLTQEAEDIADISKTVQSALKRGMSKDPADRFDSCSDFVAALSGKKVKSAKKSGKGFPKWAAVFLAMILLGAGIGGYCYFDNDKSESIVIGPEKPESTKPDPPDPDGERAIAKMVQETYRLQAGVLGKKRDIESANHDPGQSFGKYLKELKVNYEAGELALKNNDVSAANSSFKAADKAADWIIVNAPLRREVQKLLRQIPGEKSEADRFNASKLAYITYKAAGNKVSAAEKAFESAEFASAKTALNEAISRYRKARDEARTLKIKGLIASAKRAKNSEDWQKVYDSAAAALNIDSDNSEARSLRQKAENNLKPSLEIIAKVDGKRVPAKVKFGNKVLSTMGKIRNFSENGNYKGSLTYKKGEAEYVGSVDFTCDWRGPKELTVTLKKVVFNGTVTLSNGVKLEMVKVEPGTFIMSKKDGENYDDEVEHQKTLTNPFYIGKYEVTNEQWCAVMSVSEAPSSKNKGARYPVESISWREAMSFCEKMNQYAPPGWKFTLPTETQWEFAARGGNKSRGYKYSGSNNIGDVAWYSGNSGNTTHEVGEGKSPNELGIYNMSGNVWEWCLDNWNGKSNNTNAEFRRSYSDNDGSNRVLRGGSWISCARSCRSANRNCYSPGNRINYLGFRLVLVPVQ